MSDGNAYREAGVDIDAGNRAVELMKAAVRATHGPEVLAGVGAFGGLYDVSAIKEMAGPVLVASTDGVGTKVKLAQAMGRYDTVGVDLVNHCVDDILVQGARPLFFLDYVAAAQLEPETIASVVSGCAAACRVVGCALLGGETAEMPGVYVPGELDLAGTIVGVVERADIVDGSAIVPGDAVVGLASSGPHTNGYTLARHIVEGRDLRAELDELGGSLGDALLAPHRAYLHEVARLRAAGVSIHGMAHVTGGGLVDNPPRMLPDGAALVLRPATWPVPPIFGYLQREGGVSDEEMRRVFNMGLGMLVAIPAGDVDRALAALGEGAWHVGDVVPGTGDPVRFEGTRRVR